MYISEAESVVVVEPDCKEAVTFFNISVSTNFERRNTSVAMVTEDPGVQSQLLLKCFPPVVYACVYGSSVFHRIKQGDGKTISVDLILVVENLFDFHKDNLIQNPNHYNWVTRNIGLKSISSINSFGAGMWFHSDVKIKRMTVTYGVIDRIQMGTDLQTWGTLFSAGRLLQPIYILQDDVDISRLRSENLLSALSISIILIMTSRTPSRFYTFTESELYYRIVSLSYSGEMNLLTTDVSAALTEKVSTGFHQLRDMYGVFLTSMCRDGILQTSELSQSEHIFVVDATNLPVIFQYCSPEIRTKVMKNLSFVCFDTVTNSQLYCSINQVCRWAVRKSSFSQALKDVLTHGVYSTLKRQLMKI
jgi:hypothetical protein